MQHSRPSRTERRAGRLPRRLQLTTAEGPPQLPGETRLASREEALRSVLAWQGVAAGNVVVVERQLGRDPFVRALAQSSPRLRTRIDAAGARAIMVAGLRREGSDRWEIARVPVPQRDRLLLPIIILQTLVLYAAVMLLLWLVLRRITRPLADLRARTEAFSLRGAPAAPLAPRGPADISSLIAAHNAMEARIGALLDEKDVMLGAIGHDLKTPLAALRVRVEAVADADQRARMAATIEEVSHALDEILELARAGRRDVPLERAELSALVASVVEEFEDLGHEVTLHDTARLSAPVHITRLKRALRNLVANAVRYSGQAEVSLRQGDGGIVLRVDDRGPGIREDRIAAMFEPFVRGEASRNRATGGTGLGLTLARAIAEQHGGTLAIANRPGGGLRAEIRLPGPNAP